MKLTYHEGKNFGDALNPMIFYHFLGKDFFDEDSSVQFLGIGSILGLKKKAGKKIVFSSGYAAGDDDAYGSAPVIDQNYEVICVRGPKTARILNLPLEKAIADGAILLPTFYKPDIKSQRFKYSLILHHKSLDFYSGWENVCKEAGIHLIDVRKNVEQVLSEIVSSDHVLCEAMHGAIVADAYRVKWTPVNFYPHINFFKWQDWCESLLMDYKPFNCYQYLHDIDFLTEIVKKKTFLPSFLSEPIARWFLKKRIKSVVYFLNQMKTETGNLSDGDLLIKKQKALIGKLNELKLK
jgi:succinoglycan biosynthesis protein ExoV